MIRSELIFWFSRFDMMINTVKEYESYLEDREEYEEIRAIRAISEYFEREQSDIAQELSKEEIALIHSADARRDNITSISPQVDTRPTLTESQAEVSNKLIDTKGE